MKVEYTEELEKLVKLHAECRVSLIKAFLNGPLNTYYRISSRWALDKECGKWTQAYFFLFHLQFLKTVCMGTVTFRTNAILLIENKSLRKMIKINCISQLRR